MGYENERQRLRLQVLLKQVVLQGSEESVPKLSSTELSRNWDSFRAVYGRDPRPEEECTRDQLTGVDVLLKRDEVPHVDFGVWGPNHHRLLKKLRTTGSWSTHEPAPRQPPSQPGAQPKTLLPGNGLWWTTLGPGFLAIPIHKCQRTFPKNLFGELANRKIPKKRKKGSYIKICLQFLPSIP